jgi:hypothetical protein|tara:strand:- start:8035 stop:8268 length:234 start_codon:yes stop_codon:yes gene_type:complete
MKKITTTELEQLNNFHKEYNETKDSIADLEIKKKLTIDKLITVDEAYKKFDIGLSEKYGQGISINGSTGEITKKEKT